MADYNHVGEIMDFHYSKPVVTDAEVANLTHYVTSVKPTDANQSDIEDVLAVVGRMVVGGYALPTSLRGWFGAMPGGILVLSRVAMQAVVSNANYIMGRKVERAIFALTGYMWLFEPLPIIGPDEEPGTTE